MREANVQLRTALSAGYCPHFAKPPVPVAQLQKAGTKVAKNPVRKRHLQKKTLSY
jgi:hypothetical protein